MQHVKIVRVTTKDGAISRDVIIDENLYPEFKKYKWHLEDPGHSGTFVVHASSVPIEGKKTTATLGQFVMGTRRTTVRRKDFSQYDYTRENLYLVQNSKKSSKKSNFRDLQPKLNFNRTAEKITLHGIPLSKVREVIILPDGTEKIILKK